MFRATNIFSCKNNPSNERKYRGEILFRHSRMLWQNHRLALRPMKWIWGRVRKKGGRGRKGWVALVVSDTSWGAKILPLIPLAFCTHALLLCRHGNSPLHRNFKNMKFFQIRFQKRNSRKCFLWKYTLPQGNEPSIIEMLALCEKFSSFSGDKSIQCIKHYIFPLESPLLYGIEVNERALLTILTEFPLHFFEFLLHILRLETIASNDDS